VRAIKHLSLTDIQLLHRSISDGHAPTSGLAELRFHLRPHNITLDHQRPRRFEVAQVNVSRKATSSTVIHAWAQRNSLSFEGESINHV